MHVRDANIRRFAVCFFTKCRVSWTRRFVNKRGLINKRYTRPFGNLGTEILIPSGNPTTRSEPAHPKGRSKPNCLILFAGDSNVFRSHPDPHILVNILVSENENLLSWIRTNKLSLNLQTTKCMIFSNSLDRLTMNINVDGAVLEIMSSN